jgi:hypothetical protein
MVVLAERTDRAGCPRNAQRAWVVRQSGDGEARDPDLVDGRGLQQAAAGRRARRAGRVLMGRPRVAHLREAWSLGNALHTHIVFNFFFEEPIVFISKGN